MTDAGAGESMKIEVSKWDLVNNQWRIRFFDANERYCGPVLDPDQRLALATALVPNGVFVADPTGLWALIEEFELGIPWCGPDRNGHRRKIRAALGITEEWTTYYSTSKEPDPDANEGV